MNTNSVKILEDIIEKRSKNMMSNVSLVKYIQEEYKVSQSRSYELIREAKIQLGEFYKKVNENVLEDSLSRLETLLENAIEANQNKLALEIQKEMNKVNKLYQDQLLLDADSITITIKKNDD